MTLNSSRHTHTSRPERDPTAELKVYFETYKKDCGMGACPFGSPLSPRFHGLRAVAESPVARGHATRGFFSPILKAATASEPSHLMDQIAEFLDGYSSDREVWVYLFLRAAQDLSAGKPSREELADRCATVLVEANEIYKNDLEVRKSHAAPYDEVRAFLERIREHPENTSDRFLNSRGVLKDVFAKILAGTKGRGVIRAKQLTAKHVFRSLDTSKKGMLEKDELREAFATMGMNIDEKQFDEVWTEMDVNSTGCAILRYLSCHTPRYCICLDI